MMTNLKFTSPSGETTIKVQDTGRLGTVAPKIQLHIRKMDEPVKYETPMTENKEEIEKVKAQIKVLQKKLDFLEELERTKTPCEEAYKRVYGFYPETYEDSWSAFQDGYIAAQKDYKVGEFQETAQERGERVHNEMEETIRIHDGYGVVDYKPTPQTPAEEAYKRWMDVYPPTGPSVNAIDLFRWRAFQRGYDAAYQEPEENEWKSVALKLGENLSDNGPDGYYGFSADEWFEWVIDECLVNEVKRLQEKEWKSVALSFGEKLVSIGPCGYYDFTPEEWFEWVVNTYEKLCDDTVNLLKKETAQERGERLHKDVERVVRESVKWCEENPDKSVEDWLK